MILPSMYYANLSKDIIQSFKETKRTPAITLLKFKLCSAKNLRCNNVIHSAEKV